VRWLGKPDPEPWSLPLYTSEPALDLTPAKAYWISSANADVIERLRIHGVAMETLASAQDGVGRHDPLHRPQDRDPRQRGSCRDRRRTGHPRDPHCDLPPAGSVRVPTDQPLGELVTLLLEPESDESFFAWGMFPEVLQRVEYIEGYAIAPLAEKMLAADPELKAQFEAKLAADPKFAADPDARLAWFYARTPYYDDHYRLYPVGRELKSRECGGDTHSPLRSSVLPAPANAEPYAGRSTSFTSDDPMDTIASGHAAAFWTGLHLILLLTLSLLVVRLRQKHKVALGDEGIPNWPAPSAPSATPPNMCRPAWRPWACWPWSAPRRWPSTWSAWCCSPAG
jgi:hypothetical protein